jgi:NADPH:quinone reductase-like Zn-dependent oxidoreductase
MVEFDVRRFYLKDLVLIGCTAWDEPVFSNLISYIEGDEIRPRVHKTFPLGQVVAAQQDFMKKRHVGKFVLIPPTGSAPALQ